MFYSKSAIKSMNENESGESKRNVTCGICGLTGRRDNMKKQPGAELCQAQTILSWLPTIFWVASL